MSLEPARRPDGRWRPGVSGNPGGRPGGLLVKRVRELARACTEDAVHALHSIAVDEDAQGMARVQAAKELLSRGWGTASDEATLDALDRGQDDVGEIVFRMPMSLDGVEIEDGELVDDEQPALPPPAA